MGTLALPPNGFVDLETSAFIQSVEWNEMYLILWLRLGTTLNFTVFRACPSQLADLLADRI